MKWIKRHLIEPLPDPNTLFLLHGVLESNDPGEYRSCNYRCNQTSITFGFVWSA